MRVKAASARERQGIDYKYELAAQFAAATKKLLNITRKTTSKSSQFLFEEHELEYRIEYKKVINETLYVKHTFVCDFKSATMQSKCICSLVSVGFENDEVTTARKIDFL